MTKGSRVKYKSAFLESMGMQISPIGIIHDTASTRFQSAPLETVFVVFWDESEETTLVQSGILEEV